MWVNGKRNGEGTNYFANGERYEGMWKENKRQGYGTNYYKNGTVFSGNWDNDKQASSKPPVVDAIPLSSSSNKKEQIHSKDPV